MKIKKIIEMKNSCEKKMQSLGIALGMASNHLFGEECKYEDKITLTIEQAEDIKMLLEGYYNLLNDILDKAEVEI